MEYDGEYSVCIGELSKFPARCRGGGTVAMPDVRTDIQFFTATTIRASLARPRRVTALDCDRGAPYAIKTLAKNFSSARRY